MEFRKNATLCLSIYCQGFQSIIFTFLISEYIEYDELACLKHIYYELNIIPFFLYHLQPCFVYWCLDNVFINILQ